MNVKKIDEAIAEATRFIEKAKQAKKRIKLEYPRAGDDFDPCMSSKETAACKRASMDLTRLLTNLRRWQ